MRRAGATTILLLLVCSGCVNDFDALSSGHGGGSASGNAGRAGSSGGTSSGGSSASAGVSPGEAGVGAASGEAGAAGEGGGGENCQSGLTTCPGTAECTDLQVGNPDGHGVNDCGACGTTCSLDHASSATCENGVCAPTCKTGFDDCNDATHNDGCETALTTITDCGACGMACSLENVSDATCLAGACKLTCQTGFGDCNDATHNDGCETALTTPTDCSACGHACSSNGAVSQECVSGRCTPTCAPAYADCNGSATLAQDDGCELYLDSLDECTTGCAATRVACDPAKVCNGGSCVAPAGVVILSTPLTDTAQAQRFADLLAPNLEGATLIIRAYAPGAMGGTLVTFLSDTMSGFSPTTISTDLTSLSQKWTDITIPIATLGSFHANIVKQVNLEVHSSTGPWLNPTIVYVDSIRTSNLVVNDTFDSGFGNFVSSSLVTVTGSTIGWAASIP